MGSAIGKSTPYGAKEAATGGTNQISGRYAYPPNTQTPLPVGI
jgi:hypothetical protein